MNSPHYPREQLVALDEVKKTCADAGVEIAHNARYRLVAKRGNYRLNVEHGDKLTSVELTSAEHYTHQPTFFVLVCKMHEGTDWQYTGSQGLPDNREELRTGMSDADRGDLIAAWRFLKPITKLAKSLASKRPRRNKSTLQRVIECFAALHAN